MPQFMTEDDSLIDGYEIPIHRSLTEQILIGGVPRKLATLNGSIAVIFGVLGHSWYILPICAGIHVAAMAATKRDPQFFDCLRESLQYKLYYSD
jgi:type IV secretory pathway TrbD component